ncbi:alpha-L-fucosidase [Clostridium tarantellae]|uniref:alpha-L-fucosidase n=1 Tax=Clostridium tarantellae TaxID=39493 RepID=A0A6I1MK85_9CLOT|nr:alpha-L-fucosidase [Clostridium tarantellae]MPQ43936.1 carbohydrate-binding protein [Clostridium tarantellae]
MNKNVKKIRCIATALTAAIIAGNVDLSVLAGPINTLSVEKRQDIFQAHIWEEKNGEGIVITDNGADFNSIGGAIKAGDSIVYNDINFKDGSLNTMLVTISSLNKDRDKKIEVRLDSKEGELLGTINVNPSNSERVFKDHYLSIPQVTGVHDIAFVFKDDMDVNIDIFNFSQYDGNETEQEFDERMKWWRDAKYGQFIHFGPYAEAGGEYKGKWVQYSEWIMDYLRISKEDYAKDIAKPFNPSQFNAEEIVKVAKDAGQEYMVFTSRHHDGFSMYDTEIREFKDYELMSYGNYKGPDPIEELANECKKQGIKFGAYYTIYDWHDKSQDNYGHYMHPEQKEEYKTRMKGQLRELIEKYDVEVLWFDGEWANWWTKEDGQELYRYLRTLKPSLVINNRVGKKHPDDGDYGTPEQEIPPTGLDYDWETCMTLNNSWGYHKTDNNWKSPETVIENLVDVASKGGNYLLNVGPDNLGRVPEGSANVLRDVGMWMKENGESIYGTRISCFTKLPQGIKATTKEGKIYLHFTDWNGGEAIKIPAIVNDIKGMKILGTNIEVNYTKLKDGILIETPQVEGNEYDTVIEIDVVGTPEEVPTNVNVNLATKAKEVIESNYYENNNSYKGIKAVDGDLNTRWATDDNTNEATLELKFDEPITFNKAYFKTFLSNKNSVNSYNIEYWDGEKWVIGYTGGTLQEETEVTFNPITSDRIRLNITDALNPSIYEFEIFNEVITEVEVTSPKETQIVSSDGFTMEGTAIGGETVEVLVKSNNVVPVKFEGDVSKDGTWSVDVANIGEGTKNIRISLKDSDGSVVDVTNTTLKVRDKGKNLVIGKEITVSSEYSEEAGYEKNKAIDEDTATRWAPANGDKTPTMTVNFGERTTFDTVIISEMLDTWVTPNDYRCKKFKLEYNDGEVWKTIQDGTTIGEELTLKFKPVTGEQIRLTILENAASNNYAPANINEFEVYNSKKDVVQGEGIKKVENLRVNERSSNSIKLQWDAPSSGDKVAEYIIYKDGKEVAKVNANDILEYEANNLKVNTLYGFKVLAKGLDGQKGRPVSINVRTAK